MTEIKPCPFCGNEAEIRRTNVPASYAGVTSMYAVYCVTCFVHTDQYFKPETAIQIWNRRVNETDS